MQEICLRQIRVTDLSGVHPGPGRRSAGTLEGSGIYCLFQTGSPAVIRAFKSEL